MKKGDRIRLIQRCRDALGMMSSDDERLLLTTFGIGDRPVDGWGDGPSVTEWLSQEANDTDLLALGQHLGVLENEPVEMPESTVEPEPLFVFASHLSAHRGFLGAVETRLAFYRVGLFVAHDSIPMDAAWVKEIVDALNDCHAGAVFLHPGFHESFYCQQECGWMLGRGIPIARLMLGESPRALLGELQGRDLKGQAAEVVADAVLDWATSKPSLSAHLATSLSLALKHSISYNCTDLIWERLSQLPVLSREQLRRVVSAAEYNGQVYGTGIRNYAGRPYRQVVADHATAWDTEGQFTDRIAQLRVTEASNLILPPDEEVDQYYGDQPARS